MLAGCGGDPQIGGKVYPVKGKLTVGGQPVANVTVNLYPVDKAGAIASGTTKTDGTFQLYNADAREGAMAGKYKVVLVQGQDRAAAEAAYKSASGGGAAGANGQRGPTVASNLPEAYLKQDTTPKEVDITAGSNDLKLDL
jgi:hypothetical protein